MLEFNVGELATRLRAALGVRGRMPLGLDEHIIPTAAVADVTGPPWRRNPVAAQAAMQFTSAGIGNAASIHLGFPTVPNILDSLFSTTSVFVLTGYSLQPLNTVLASGAAVTVNSACAFLTPQTVAAMPIGNSVNLVTTERYGTLSPSLSAYAIPLYLGGDTLAGGGVPTPTSIQAGRIAQVQAGVVQPPVWTPCCIALRPGDGIRFFSQHLITATEGSALAVVVEGLYYGLG